jgi:hypothetical protein
MSTKLTATFLSVATQNHLSFSWICEILDYVGMSTKFRRHECISCGMNKPMVTETCCSFSYCSKQLLYCESCANNQIKRPKHGHCYMCREPTLLKCPLQGCNTFMCHSHYLCNRVPHVCFSKSQEYHDAVVPTLLLFSNNSGAYYKQMYNKIARKETYSTKECFFCDNIATCNCSKCFFTTCLKHSFHFHITCVECCNNAIQYYDNHYNNTVEPLCEKHLYSTFKVKIKKCQSCNVQLDSYCENVGYCLSCNGMFQNLKQNSHNYKTPFG